MANVLITDGEQRAALAVTRSLGRAGHRIFVCSSRTRSLAGSSRYALRQGQVPDPLSDPQRYVATLQAWIAEWGVDVLIPISEPSLLAVLPARDRLPGVRVPFAPLQNFIEICDKAAVAAAAETVGIQVPRQVVLATPQERLGLEQRASFPVVLKPSRSVVGDAGERVKTGVVHADGPAALDRALARLPAEAYPVLVQERIIGPGVGIFVLLRGGELRAAFAHRRIREKPPSGGVSVYRESAPLDKELLQRSIALLRRFQWEGVAMVEYKVDEATGTSYIMEINGRFWGSLQLAIDAGVDFPRLLVEAPDGPALTDYTLGVRSRWEWGDIDHLLVRLRRSDEQLALPPGSPGRARAALDFLRAFGPGSRNEVLRTGDPVPFLRESLDWLRGR